MPLNKAMTWRSEANPSRWVLVLAVLIAIGAAFAVSRLHDQVDSRRQHQLGLARIENLGKQLRDAEEGALLDKGGSQPESMALRRSLSEAVAKLAASDLEGDAAANVSEAADAYLDNAGEHLRLLQAGQTIAAHQWDVERSGPSYQVLLDAIFAATHFYSAQTSRVLRRANLGSTLAIVAQALLVSLLVFLAEHSRRANELRLSEERARKDAQFRSMIQNSSDVVSILSGTGEIRYVSPAVRKVLGYDPEERLGRGFDFLHPEDSRKTQEAFYRFLDDSETSYLVEVRARHADGSWRWIEISGTNLLADPNVRGVVLNYRDVTERRDLQEQLRHQALHDALTGLANRSLFHNLLAHSLSAAKRRQTEVAVFYLDLDNFKQINDGLGHEAGDQLLIQVAARLRENVRMEDTPARLGGDEFAILTEGMDRHTAAQLAQRLLKSLQQPYDLAGQQVAVGASIGIAFAEPGEASPEDLLRDADVAMYVAKGTGKGRFEIFESSMYRKVKEQLDLELDFRYALENQQFEMVYQPIIELESGNLVAVEALVRWRDEARRRLLLPAEFLPLAERTGLILPLGRWILDTACRQAQEWRARYPQAAHMLLSVNLSERQFLDPGLVETVKRALAASGMSGEQLILEVAEEVLLQNMEVAAPRLRELKDLGIRLAIDDFGGGYTALRKLRRLPVDVVKIHKSFVDGLTASPSDSELTHSLIDLARRLKLQTHAEGIEVDRQAVALGKMGCELGQGFHLARPLDPAGLGSLLSGLEGGDWRERPAGDARRLVKGIA